MTLIVPLNLPIPAQAPPLTNVCNISTPALTPSTIRTSSPTTSRTQPSMPTIPAHPRITTPTLLSASSTNTDAAPLTLSSTSSCPCSCPASNPHVCTPANHRPALSLPNISSPPTASSRIRFHTSPVLTMPNRRCSPRSSSSSSKSRRATRTLASKMPTTGLLFAAVRDRRRATRGCGE